MTQATLGDHLKDQLKWQVYNFDWNGPNPPYVRIGLKIRLGPFRLDPCFESFLRDRAFVFRSNISVRDCLRPFNLVRVDSRAFDESYPRGYAEQIGFPVDRWVAIRRVQTHYLHVADEDENAHLLPLEVLCGAAMIQLARA